MSVEIPKLLKQLWQSKAAVTPTGLVTYQPKAERTVRELRKAYGEVGNLLVVRLDAIGDNFLFLDSYRKLRELFPKTNIVVVTYSENRPIYERCPHINKALYVEREPLATSKPYRETCFRNLQQCEQPWDIVFNPLYSREYLAEEIVKAAPGHIKIGVGGDNSNMSRDVMKLTDPAYGALLPVDTSVIRHELHRHNEILSLLGSQDETIRFKAPLTDEDRQFAANILKNFDLKKYGVVFPGTKGGTNSIKYWGSENYSSLMDQLQLEGGWELMMLLGGHGEEQIASEISALTRAKPHVFQGDLSLWQAAAVLERAAFYVGSDTSMAHIATAMKIPTFAILGGGHFGRFFPYPEGHSDVCLTHKLDCFQCYWKCKLSYNKCIADISVAQVLGAMKEKNLSTRPKENATSTTTFHIGARRSSLPKVDLVLPPGMQTWHLKESWAIILEKAGCLNRVFRPTPETVGHFLSYLRTGGDADFLLAIGGDHHLSFLHDTEDKQAAWHQYRGHRVCNSFESTRDSLYKRYVVCVKNAMKVYTHFVFTDEVDAKIFEAANIPALWWPQAADARLFSNQKPPSQRKPQVFFCGKVWNEYPLRKSLLQNLQSAQLCNVVERASAGEMVAHYNQHLLAINLPGVLGGFNVRTYESLACGSLLLQFQPSHRPANNALFQNGAHVLYYDYTNVEKLKATVQNILKNPARFFDIAKCGHEELLAQHTIEKRFAQLVDWLFDGHVPQYPQYGNVTPEVLQLARERRYVNDKYLFDGRPLWNANALNEFADLQFVNYHALLPRLCQQGEHLAGGKREVEAMRVFKRALDLDSDTDNVHNNLGVLCWQRGERSKAVEHFEAALVDNPRYRPALINYGEALTLSGRATEAQQAYVNFLKQEDDAGIRALIEASN
jgi:ADP-heptose:LPS heptosyltransferase/tetratricopeptide (TPR) repeat protein